MPNTSLVTECLEPRNAKCPECGNQSLRFYKDKDGCLVRIWCDHEEDGTGCIATWELPVKNADQKFLEYQGLVALTGTDPAIDKFNQQISGQRP